MKTTQNKKWFDSWLRVGLFWALTIPLIFVQKPALLTSSPTKDTRPLQFIAGEHLSGFASNDVYAATNSHTLYGYGEYNARSPLISDTTLMWNTFLGNWEDIGMDIAVDAGGNIYVVGVSSHTWGSPIRAFDVINDVFVVKLSSDGVLQWNTFLGSSGDDNGRSIALDGDGNIYVLGSSDLTWESPTHAHMGDYDGFVAKLDPNGVLLWNTFLGGDGNDDGSAISVDENGDIYVLGVSDADWGCAPVICTVRAYTSGRDVFTAKLDSDGTLQWNTFLGDSGNDSPGSMGVDNNGDLYLSGSSKTAWGLPLRAYAGDLDAFVAKLNSNGALLWNTFLGGSDHDGAGGIAVDGSGNTYIVGFSNASWGSPVRMFTVGNTAWEDDSFAAKLDSNGELQWNTFLGGSESDNGAAIALDGNENVYVLGSSADTWGAPLRAYTNRRDAFTAKLNSDGALQWNTFLGGGEGTDYGTAIALDGNGNFYVTGYSTETWGNPVRTYNGQVNAFVVKAPSPTFSDVPVDYWSYQFIGRLYDAGITSGCNATPLMYCPNAPVTRAEMAIFLLRAKHGSSYTPPAAVGNVFGDVPASHWAAAWIEQLYAEGITVGCGDGGFCPETTVTRDQMAIFLLRAEHGDAYVPPTMTGVFTDVPVGYWAGDWIEQLYLEGITGGCSTGLYCPTKTVTRDQMAVFLVRAFNLP